MSLANWILGLTMIGLAACSGPSQESDLSDDVLSGSGVTMKIDATVVTSSTQIHGDTWVGYPSVAPGSAANPQYWGKPGHAVNMKFSGLSADTAGQVGNPGYRFEYNRCPTCQESFASKSGWFRILPYATVQSLTQKYRVNIKADYNYLVEHDGDNRTTGGSSGVVVGCRRTVAAGGWMPDANAGPNDTDVPLGLSEGSHSVLAVTLTWQHGQLQIQTAPLDLRKCGGDLFFALMVNNVVGAQFYDPEVQLLAVTGG